MTRTLLAGDNWSDMELKFTILNNAGFGLSPPSPNVVCWEIAGARIPA